MIMVYLAHFYSQFCEPFNENYTISHILIVKVHFENALTGKYQAMITDYLSPKLDGINLKVETSAFNVLDNTLNHQFVKIKI